MKFKSNLGAKNLYLFGGVLLGSFLVEKGFLTDQTTES